MFITKQISAGKIIEMQSYGSEPAMRGNAVAAGYATEDVEWLEVTQEVYEALIAAGRTTEQIIAQKEAVIDAHCETVAKAKGYGRQGVPPSVACLGYAGFTNPYQVEAQAYVAWVASLWPLAYQIMDEVLAGTRPVPTDEELIAELPKMVWPE